MPKKQPKAKQPDTGATVSKDPVLEEAIDKGFQLAWDYTSQSLHDRWDVNYKAYHNIRTKRGYEGITDTFVPMVFGTIETLTSALFGTKPKFSFLPPRSNPDQNTDILNAVIDYYWERGQWSIKVVNTGRTGLTLGNGIDYYCWVGDRVDMFSVPLRDFFIDPTATSFEDARFMGRRYLTTVDELESFEVVDLDNPIETMGETGEVEVTYAMKPKYKNLDKVKALVKNGGGNTDSDQQTDKQAKDDLYGTTLSGKDTGQVEVVEYWTNDKVVSVVNRNIVIEDAENYYKAKARENELAKGTPEEDIHVSGIMPFAGFRDYVDPALFYAKGEVDFIIDEQELLNDITNQNIDAITYVLNPMFTLDPKYADKIMEVENLPGAVYPFEAGTLNRIEMGNLPTDAFNERMNIKNEIRETTASNEVVKGVGQIEGGKATATEINAQIAGAGQRIGLKITQIENEYLHRMARIVFEMVKLYVTEPMMVRIVGRDGARWEEFNPADFQDDYEPRVQLDIRAENEKQEKAAQSKEMYAAFLGDPDVNQQELKKLVLARGFDLEPDEVDQLLTVDPMQAMGGMGGMGGIDPMNGMPTDPSMAGAMSGAMPTVSPDMMSAMPGGMGMMPPETAMGTPLPEEDGIDTDLVAVPVTGELVDTKEID